MMNVLKIKLMKKEDFVNTNRLFETTPEEIEQDWKRYVEQLNTVKKNERLRRKVNVLMKKEDFVNANRLFQTTPEEIEEDWKLYVERFNTIKKSKRCRRR